MSFREIKGDLFELGLPAIGHGVNCQGVMGAGIARVFRMKYPDMYEAYKVQCDSGRITLGGIMSWKAGDVTILNLATQFNPGADATLWAVMASVRTALAFCVKNDIPVLGLPRIGCGIGGLLWHDVRAVMHIATEEFQRADLVAVTLPGQV
jgi:O-acetyl-ADP-ribose deacetylase (regulator of RNase III)